MNRRTLGVAIVLLCCVGALVLAAGTLTQTTDTGEDADAPAADVNEDVPETDTPIDSNIDGGDRNQRPPVKTDRCDRSLPPYVVIGLVTLVVGTTAGMYYRYDRMVALACFVAVAVLVASFLPFLVTCPDDGIPEEQQNGTPGVIENQTAEGGGGDGSGSGERGERRQQLPSTLLLLVGILGIAVVVVAGVWVVRSGEGDDAEHELVDATGEDEAEGQPDPADLDAVAAAAGRAADRIQAESPVDNEIFRAWVEMTGHLPVARPDTSTPREFEQAAVEAGFDAEPVGELTDLFESVRYGRESVTDDREARAVEALRRVEAQYEGEDE